MGMIVSSNQVDFQLVGSQYSSTIAYAYATNNTKNFGIPVTLNVGEGTAFEGPLQTPVATFPIASGQSATVTCSFPGFINGPSVEVIPLQCPFPVTSIAPGTAYVEYVSAFTTPASTDASGSSYPATTSTQTGFNENLMSFTTYDPSYSPPTVTITTTKTVTKHTVTTSDVGSLTGAKRTKYLSIPKSCATSSALITTSSGLSKRSATVLDVDVLAKTNKTSTATASSASTSSTTKTSTSTTLSTSSGSSSYTGPVTKVIAKTVQKGYATPDFAYTLTTATTTTTILTTETDVTTTYAIFDNRTTTTVSGQCSATKVTPTACPTTPWIINTGDNVYWNYTTFFSGASVTEDPGYGTNNGTDLPYIENYPATSDSCTVIRQCLTDLSKNMENNPVTWESVDMHFDQAAQMWYCIGYTTSYEGGNGTESGFTVKNKDVSAVYGIAYYGTIIPH